MYIHTYVCVYIYIYIYRYIHMYVPCLISMHGSFERGMKPRLV